MVNESFFAFVTQNSIYIGGVNTHNIYHVIDRQTREGKRHNDFDEDSAKWVGWFQHPLEMDYREPGKGPLIIIHVGTLADKKSYSPFITTSVEETIYLRCSRKSRKEKTVGDDIADENDIYGMIGALQQKGAL